MTATETTSGKVHEHVPHPFAGMNARMADKLNAVFGSMRMFWVLVCWQLAWMALATLGVWVFKQDRYPFAFLLFLSNLIQLWALPILGSTANRADEKRNAKANSDHEALTHIATVVDADHDQLERLVAVLGVPREP